MFSYIEWISCIFCSFAACLLIRKIVLENYRIFVLSSHAPFKKLFDDYERDKENYKIEEDRLQRLFVLLRQLNALQKEHQTKYIKFWVREYGRKVVDVLSKKDKTE